jgi:hypothetical protein
VAFAISAVLLGLGFILAIVLLPSKRRLDQQSSAAAPGPGAPAEAAPAAAAPARAPAQPASAQPASAQPAAAQQQGFEAIPVALCSCSPVVSQTRDAETAPART